jgi:hypothetical protein
VHFYAEPKPFSSAKRHFLTFLHPILMCRITYWAPQEMLLYWYRYICQFFWYRIILWLICGVGTCGIKIILKRKKIDVFNFSISKSNNWVNCLFFVLINRFFVTPSRFTLYWCQYIIYDDTSSAINNLTKTSVSEKSI